MPGLSMEFGRKGTEFLPQTLIFLSQYLCNPMSLQTLDISNYEFIPSRYFIFISIVIVKEWLLYFSLCLIGRGEILHRPFYAQTCSARLGLDWTRLGIKGFATFTTLSSFFCMFVSTRSSTYMFSRYFLDKVKIEFQSFSFESFDRV